MYTRADLAPDQPGLEPLIPVLELLLIFFSRSATVIPSTLATQNSPHREIVENIIVRVETDELHIYN